MQPDRWKHLQDVYFRALELPEDRRRLFLDTTCRLDPTMRQEVESLLKYEHKINAFLEPISPDLLVAMGPVDYASVDETFVDDEFIGNIIDGRYLIRDLVGSGGMGVVYRADHRLLGTSVAIKRLSAEFREKKQFRKQAVEEARRAVQLDHENVARVKDVVEESNEVFVVMEFIDGQTLLPLLDHPVALDKFLDIATQCAAALAAAHEKQIAHLDIKPANIMLTGEGRVKICDFGVARQLRSDGQSGDEGRWRFAGTPSYMAPEVLEGNQFNVQADVFSLGVVFYEMLSGKHPFRSEDVQTTTNRIVHDPPPPLEGSGKKLPARLIQLVERMLSKDAAGRLSAVETLHELRRMQRRLHFFRNIRLAPGEMLPLLRRRPWTTAAIFVTIAALAVGSAYLKPLLFGLPSLPNVKRVAILPFEVSEQRLDRRAYAEGISTMVADRLTDRLMRVTAVPTLIVEPASYVRDRRINTPEKARGELGATIAVKGWFEFSENRTRFNYQVIRTEDGHPVRGDYVGLAPDDQSLEDTIIRKIAADLERELAPDPASATKNPQALDLYREGMGNLSHYHDPLKLAAAEALLKKAVKLDGHYAAAYIALGQAYWYQYRKNNRDRSLLEQSLEACEKAERLTSNSSEVQVCLGRVHQEMGRLPLAKELYEKAIAFSATNDEAFVALGSVLEEMNLFEEAEDHYKWAIDVRKEFKDWRPYSWLAGFYFERHQYEKALENYRMAQELSGRSNAQIYYSMAAPYVYLGLWEMAKQSLDQSVDIRKYAPRPLSNYGVLFLMQRKYKEALSYLEDAYKAEIPGDLETNYRVTGNLARIYKLTGQSSRAQEMYKLAIEQGMERLQYDERDHRVYILLGRYHAELGQMDEARNHLNRALTLKPHDPHYLLIASTAYLAIGERRNALQCMEESAKYGYGKVQIKAEPELDALENEPSYKNLMRSLEKPQ